jgi:hypothetical protein
MRSQSGRHRGCTMVMMTFWFLFWIICRICFWDQNLSGEYYYLEGDIKKLHPSWAFHLNSVVKGKLYSVKFRFKFLMMLHWTNIWLSWRITNIFPLQLWGGSLFPQLRNRSIASKWRLGNLKDWDPMFQVQRKNLETRQSTELGGSLLKRKSTHLRGWVGEFGLFKRITLPKAWDFECCYG